MASAPFLVAKLWMICTGLQREQDYNDTPSTHMYVLTMYFQAQFPQIILQGIDFGVDGVGHLRVQLSKFVVFRRLQGCILKRRPVLDRGKASIRSCIADTRKGMGQRCCLTGVGFVPFERSVVTQVMGGWRLSTALFLFVERREDVKGK